MVNAGYLKGRGIIKERVSDMATLCIRNFPEDLLARVRKLAEEHGRTVDQEIIALLQSGLEFVKRQEEMVAVFDRIGRRRAAMAPARPGEDSVSLIREDCER